MNTTSSTIRRSALAVGIGLMLTLAACGDDAAESADDTVATSSTAASNTEPADDSADTDTTDTTDGASPIEGPVSTVSADVPDEFLVAVGPMDVDGEALAPLTTDDIDADVAVGTPAPTIVGLDFDGEPVRIDAAQDGPTMVVFLAHWCSHCNAEVPVFNELRDDGRFPEDLNIVAISTSPDPGAPNFPPGEWLVEKDWTYPAIADGVDMDAGVFMGAEAFGVSGFPFVVLVDEAGDVVARWSGEQDPDVTIQTIEERLGL